MELSQEESRFLPLVKALSEQAHEELAPHIPLEKINSWAEAGLVESFRTFRSRQGASLRTYLTYRIRAAIYKAMTPIPWPSVDSEKRFRFAKKSNELLLHFTISAESAVRRSTKLEEDETMEILSLLVVVGLLIWDNVPRGEIQQHWNHIREGLEAREKKFMQEYFNEDQTLETASGMTSAQAYRMLLKILQKLSRGLKQA